MKNEKKLIQIIRFLPILFLLILSILITKIVLYDKNENFEKEIKKIENIFIENNKNRVKEEIQRVYDQIKLEKEKSEELLKKRIKDRVYEAHRIATNIYEAESKNEIHKNTHPNNHVLKTIKNTLSGIRYNNGRGYIFMVDNKGNSILQPINKSYEGKSAYNLNSKSINKAVTKIIASINNKTEGYSTYPWIKFDDITRKYMKISYVKYFEPFNLAIGSGEYIDSFENELKKELLERIRKIKFNKTGYIFVYNLDGTCLSHFKKKFIGVNRIKLQDSRGNYIVKDVLEFAKKEKEGFMSYIATMKPNEKVKSREKISYIKLFDDWKWVIGTGFYLDSLDAQIKKEKDLLILSNDASINKIMIISLFFTIIVLLTSFYISKKIEKRFLNYRKNQFDQLKKELESKDKLLQLEEEFNSFFELSINLQLIATIEGKVLQINGACKSMLGYEKEELINISFINLVHPDDKERTIKKMSRLSKGESINFFENRYRHKDGNYIDLAWSSTTDKEHKLIYASAQNTTESKLLENEKNEKEKMLYQQSKLAAMGEMLGNIAHQWRQPLSVISTAATGAKVMKEMGSLSSEQLDSSLESINNSTQFLSQTIDDFRGFFDINNNALSKFNISKTIDKSLNLVEAQFKAKEINIIKNITDFELFSIENEVIQVLINILNNARDALVEKNKNKKFVFINTYKKDNFSYIEIIDNAGGIEKHVLNRIFEPYFTTKHKSQGTGIGLYMSEEIIKKHLNGNLSAQNDTFTYENIEYKGAKFIIKIDLNNT